MDSSDPVSEEYEDQRLPAGTRKEDLIENLSSSDDSDDSEDSSNEDLYGDDKDGDGDRMDEDKGPAGPSEAEIERLDMRIAHFEAQVNENPQDFERHVQLIALLQDVVALQQKHHFQFSAPLTFEARLRSAFTRLSETFPLPDSTRHCPVSLQPP